MYTVIRRYEGVTDTAEIVRRATEGFAPRLSGRPGFSGYWAVDAGNGVVATITVFESQEQAEATTGDAAEWVRENNLAELAPNPPQVTAGETTGVSP